MLKRRVTLPSYFSRQSKEAVEPVRVEQQQKKPWRFFLAIKGLARGAWSLAAWIWHVAEAIVWLMVVLILIVLALAVAHKLGVQLPVGLEKILNSIINLIPLKEVINHV